MVTVALDIGHGSNTFPPSKGIYKDGKAYPEHSFNQKLVTAIDPLLQANGITTIIYQKPNKPDVPLIQRTNYYNAQGVDLVYSIHANYNDSSAVNGRCAFYWHTSSKSKRLADTVVDEIKKAGYSTHGDGLHASERGSWTNLHICRETKMPAVLVENGFMTGSSDFDLVFGSKQSAYIKDMAVVHAKAICRYFGIKYNGKDVTPVKPSKPNKPASTPKPNKTGNARIRTIQSTLNSRYKTGLKVDGYDGPLTKKALVKGYQTELNKQFKAGLNIDGIWGTKTATASVTVRKGARGNLTWLLQARLYCLGYNPKGLDSIFGNGLYKAVRSFQGDKKLTVDGVPGKATFAKLFG
jgi:N-acetylmuramoyl-L-alanine amidase